MMNHEKRHDKPPTKWFSIWTPFDILMIVLGSLALLALLFWLETIHAWWSPVIQTYIVSLLVCGSGIGAYAGWAFDNLDDATQERHLAVQLVVMALGLPLLFVLGEHVFGVSFDEAPGRWPPTVDLVARGLFSCIPAPLVLAFPIALVRRQPRSWRIWIAGLLYSFAFAVLAAWPWLTGAAWLRGAVTVGLLGLGSAAAWKNRPPPGASLGDS